MAQSHDLSRCLSPLVQSTTLVVVIELSQASWLVAGVVPGVARQPLKKMEPNEPTPAAAAALARRGEARATIERIVVAYESGRDGFWLARWLANRGIEVHVIHSSSVAVSREHERAKTDRLDTAMLSRVFLGWLRGERGHCGMVVVPTLAEEDAKRPNRQLEKLAGEWTRIVNRMKAALARLGIRGFKPKLRRRRSGWRRCEHRRGANPAENCLRRCRRDLARLALVREQKRQIEQSRLERLQQAPKTGPNVMVLMLASVIGIGIDTADMLVQELLSRNLRDRRAVGRSAGLTGSPDESGAKRREKGLPSAATPGCDAA